MALQLGELVRMPHVMLSQRLKLDGVAEGLGQRLGQSEVCRARLVAWARRGRRGAWSAARAGRQGLGRRGLDSARSLGGTVDGLDLAVGGVAGELGRRLAWAPRGGRGARSATWARPPGHRGGLSAA
jgi:hypothetical protein